jgi:sec-independent protein translocase protein TatB
MFDIGFSELLVIAVVALVVLGPERLPKAARFAGLWVRRARAQWYSVKAELERELAAEELRRNLQAARREVEEAGRSIEAGARDVEKQVREAEAQARREAEALRREVAPEAGATRDGDVGAGPAPRQPDLLEQAPDAGRGTGTHDGTEGEDGRQR